jgi:hypothetical protein
MADLAAVKTGIAAALNTLDGVRAHAITPDQVHVPAILLDPREVDFRTAFGRGHELWTIDARVLVATVNNSAAQKARDSYFGGIHVVYDAIKTYPPLHDGSVAASAEVVRAERFNAWKFDEITYLGVQVVLEVRA